MGSLVKGVLASQEGGLGAKAVEPAAARGLLGNSSDSGVVCTFYTQRDDIKKRSNDLSVSVCDDMGLTCQFCHGGSREKDLGKVLCFQSSTSHDGRALYLHHACATLSANGKDLNLMDLMDALDMASRRRCRICSQLGACIQCSYGGCDQWYHRQCSMNATDVVVDTAQGCLFCPKHTVPDSDDSRDDIVRSRKRSKKGVSYDMDDDFALSHKKSRTSLGKKQSKRRESSSGKNNGDAAQRPRTDWQRKGLNTWVKVVPPWWCEQKTVHFANKVFRELFNSGTSVNLVDDQGYNWLCDVVAETRNDLRLQYTLKGQFQDLWDAIGIAPGNILMFEKSFDDPNIIHLTKHDEGSEGFEDLSRGKPRKTADATQPTNMCIVSETPWHFTDDDHKATKVLQAANLAKMKCSIPDNLWSKIFSTPDVGNTFAVYDADLKKHFVFEIESDSKKNEKHIMGNGFMSWLVERAVKPDDAIQMSISDAHAIQVSKIPSKDIKRSVDASTDTLTTCSSTSMDTLAAAAFYAHTHGTPGIKAILHCEDNSSAEAVQEPKAVEKAHTIRVLPGKPVADPHKATSPATDLKLSHASFNATMKVISGYTWTQEEHDLILKFRAKYASLDYIGKEITSYSILQFRNNKDVLLEILRSFVSSISTSTTTK